MSTTNQAAKVVLNGEVILDVSNSTATETEVAQGYTFVKSTGEQVVGTLKTNIFQYEISSTSDYSTVDAVFEHIATLVSDGTVVLRNGDYCIIEENIEPDTKTTSYIYNQNSSTWLFVGTNATSANIGRPGTVIGAEIFNDYDNNIASKNYAHAEGCSTTASGEAAHAEGTNTTASGANSHAEGCSTQATGERAHAEGSNTTAEGWYSHTEGEQAKALGESSHAEGWTTTAQGSRSHAEGDSTVASGIAAHAEGKSSYNAMDTGIDFTSDENIINAWTNNGQFALAKGEASHIEGQDNLALGNYSHTEGFQTIAAESCAHAEGSATKATSDCAHAEGGGTEASGSCAHAEGNTTIADGNYSHAEGDYTTALGTSAHAEGTETTVPGAIAHAEGYGTTACGDCSHAEGESQFSGADYLVNSMGYSLNELKSLSADTIQGAWSSTQFSWAHGQASHVEGKNNLALGNYSHAEGEQNIAGGTCAHTEGYTTTAKGDYSHAEGNNTTALGEASHAEGADTQITANARYAHTEGKGTYANGDCQHAEGSYNKKDSFGEYIHIIGNGISDEERSNAHTVEWDGTGWFAGDVYVGSDSKTNKDDGSKKLATEEYVDQKISQSGGSGGGGSVDLSNYYTKDEVNNLIPNTEGFVTEHKMQTYVDQQMVQIGAMYETTAGLTKDYNVLTLRDGRYYLIRQFLFDSEQCHLSYSDDESTLSFDFSELECVCMSGAAFGGYRYRSAGSDAWIYELGNILPDSIVTLGPGTIVQSFAITSLQEMNNTESTEES